MQSFQVSYNNETTRKYNLYELRLLHTTRGGHGIKETGGGTKRPPTHHFSTTKMKFSNWALPSTKCAGWFER